MEAIRFFQEMELPTTTAQQRRWTAHGKTYQTNANRKAKALFQAVMERHAPDKPCEAAVSLAIHLYWRGKGDTTTPRTKKPDVDNYVKLILDVMTICGYWIDDRQVAELVVTKHDQQSDGIPGIVIHMEEIR